MARTLQLSERDRYALFLHLTAVPCQNFADQRRHDRLWTRLVLDPFAVREGKVLVNELSTTLAPYELEDADSDLLRDALDRPMSAGLSRFLFPIGRRLTEAP